MNLIYSTLFKILEHRAEFCELHLLKNFEQNFYNLQRTSSAYVSSTRISTYRGNVSIRLYRSLPWELLRLDLQESAINKLVV